jgi:hypothetical protein
MCIWRTVYLWKNYRKYWCQLYSICKMFSLRWYKEDNRGGLRTNCNLFELFNAFPCTGYWTLPNPHSSRVEFPCTHTVYTVLYTAAYILFIRAINKIYSNIQHVEDCVVFGNSSQSVDKKHNFSTDFRLYWAIYSFWSDPDEKFEN